MYLNLKKSHTDLGDYMKININTFRGVLCKVIMMTDRSSALPRTEQRPRKHSEYLGDEDNDYNNFNYGSLNDHMILLGLPIWEL